MLGEKVPYFEFALSSAGVSSTVDRRSNRQTQTHATRNPLQRSSRPLPTLPPIALIPACTAVPPPSQSLCSVPCSMFAVVVVYNNKKMILYTAKIKPQG